ncbi:MAG: HEAT repeat domain-containing protein [Planctomycetota bacterium]|jgi:Flp pilus assembly protein TadD|nr:HEAT repeat domain-containing protein [Planctomycetota bacterium]
MRTACFVAAVILIALLAGACVDDAKPATASTGTDAAAPAQIVGRDRCTDCHEAEHAAWSGSHHDLAMAEATEDTVLGDFNDTSFTDAAGITTRFHRDGTRFLVTTQDGAGQEREFVVSHTFGWTPLQQYLIPFEKGRVQCLPIAWDSRPSEQGGQRWFHVYGDEAIPPGDLLHWTGPLQNWNHMCADCHSTELRKNYDAASGSFTTTWTDIDVSCEACHGPGSGHITWLEKGQNPRDTTFGFERLISGAARLDWRFVDGQPTAVPGPEPRNNDRQINTCAPCHSRRTQLFDQTHGSAFADVHQVDELLPPTWHVDGQILDEDYVYHSFVQSKMYHAGVTCTDCHDQHSLKVRATDNSLCARCHQADHYDQIEHHQHPESSTGAACIACHMPHQTYMQVDDRRDHRFGIPRPDLSVALGVPNACTQCHDEQDDTWAAAQAKTWWGEPDTDDRFALAMHAGETGQRDALTRLRVVLGDAKLPAIQRAAALYVLLQLDPQPPLALLQAASTDPNPDLRMALADAVRNAPSVDPVPLVAPLLRDEHTAIRALAARALAGRNLNPQDAAAFAAARAELNRSYQRNADRAESQTDHALVLHAEGNLAESEQALRLAITLGPNRPTPRANLADLLRQRGDNAGCRAVLEQGIADLPGAGELHHALGLALIRDKDLPAALPALERAATLRPDIDRFTFVYAVALESVGRRADAVATLEALLERNPSNEQARAALRSWR